MPSASPRILIVDDVEDMRELLRAMVESIPGLQVSGTAGNGWEARLELDRRCPDLILLDEILPGESSLDLLKEFRERGVPVMLVTGVQNPTHALPEGAFGRLVKPGWDTLATDQARIQALILSALKA